jgi:hypothetical protein
MKVEGAYPKWSGAVTAYQKNSAKTAIRRIPDLFKKRLHSQNQAWLPPFCRLCREFFFPGGNGSEFVNEIIEGMMNAIKIDHPLISALPSVYGAARKCRQDCKGNNDEANGGTRLGLLRTYCTTGDSCQRYPFPSCSHRSPFYFFLPSISIV